MSAARKLVWLALTLGLACLTARTGSGAALGLLAAMVLVPLCCLPVDLVLARRVKLSVRMPVNGRRGETAEAELIIHNPTRLPGCLVCRAQVENQLNGQRASYRLSRGVAPKRGGSMALSLTSSYCGRLRLTVEEARLYDCFGLIGIRVPTDAHGSTVIQPETFPQSLLVSPAQAYVQDNEDFANDRPGQDLSEVFQIRDYVPGDSQRQIHWKLSHKYDKLIVKDPSLPITRSAAVFWERTEDDPTPERTDAQAEIVVSICRNLLAQSVQFTVGWNDAAGQCVFMQVRELDDLIGILPRLLTASATRGLSGAALLRQSTPPGAYSHLIYVAAQRNEAVDSLPALGRLTALICGECFNEEGYAEQLAELEL